MTIKLEPLYYYIRPFFPKFNLLTLQFWLFFLHFVSAIKLKSAKFQFLGKILQKFKIKH